MIGEHDPAIKLGLANLRHAIAITLLSTGMSTDQVAEKLRIDVSDNPAALAGLLISAVEDAFYPDGKGVHRGEWSRNVRLKFSARQFCENLRIECVNGLMREQINSKEARAERRGLKYLHNSLMMNETPEGEYPSDLLDWADLMKSVDAQTIVTVGLAKVPLKRVPWALMALIRYTANWKDFSQDLELLSKLVALVAEIETSNA